MEEEVDAVMEKIFNELQDSNSTQEEEINDICYFKAVELFHKTCYNLGENSYALMKVENLRRLCSKDNDSKLFKTIHQVCSYKNY